MKVAVTGVGGGVGQAIIRALRRSRLPVSILGLDADPWAVGLYQCDDHAVIPSVSDGEAYAAALEKLVRERNIDVLIPGTDTELQPVADARERLTEAGCCPIISDPDFVRTSRDKLLSYAALTGVGIPFVWTTSVEEFAKSSSRASFPVIIKPRGGSGSVGAKVFHAPEELATAQLDAEDIVQEYLVPKSWGLGKPRPADVLKAGRLRQEDEVSIQAAIGPGGEIIGIFASINELRDGVPIRICPTLDPDTLAFARRVFEVFIGMGHVGPCNIQGRATDSGLVLYEVNARFTGITAVRAALGWNECEAALRLFVLKESPESAGRSLRYGTDTVCLRYTTEHFVGRSEIKEPA